MEKLAVTELVMDAFLNQTDLNNQLQEDWHQTGWPYYRAVWTELAEAIQHANWLWWKRKQYNQPLSTQQQDDIYIELCDVLHFGLSMDIISAHGDANMLLARAESYVDAFEDARHVTCQFEEDLEGCVIDAILLRTFNVKKFARACGAVGLSLSGLLLYYFAKTELNKFRWSLGYKEGKYVKMWKLSGHDKPQEDNVFLCAVIAGMRELATDEILFSELKDGSAQEFIKGQLAAEYQKQIAA